MTRLVIPIDPSGDWVQWSMLDGIKVDMRFMFEPTNPEHDQINIDRNDPEAHIYDGFFYLDIWCNDSGVVFRVDGIRLVTGCDLLGNMAINELGQLWIESISGQDIDVSFDSLTDELQLVYYTKDHNFSQD